jgi:hypothetical protein
VTSLQCRNGVYRLLFQYHGRQANYTIGEVSLIEARQWKFRTENLLMRVKQNMLEVPRGVKIAEFILHDGKPPVDPALSVRKDTTFHQLREGYIATVSNGALEANSIYTIKIHLSHIEETIGKHLLLAALTLGKLQDHVNRRAKTASGVTLKKEVDSFRSVWNWGLRMRWVDQPFPGVDRHEPRVVKNRNDIYPKMTRPRDELRKSLKKQAKGA